MDTKGLLRRWACGVEVWVRQGWGIMVVVGLEEMGGGARRGEMGV